MIAKPDYRFEIAVGRVLHLGIVASSGCLAVGLACALAGLPSLSSRVLTGGLMMLFATPAARLFVAAVMYARQREWLFVGLTLIVAGGLVASIFAARHSP